MQQFIHMQHTDPLNAMMDGEMSSLYAYMLELTPQPRRSRKKEEENKKHQ